LHGAFARARKALNSHKRRFLTPPDSLAAEIDRLNLYGWHGEFRAVQ
jgi:hypothetical protein